MVKTRHRGDLNDDSEEEFISLRHRSTRRHPVVKPEANVTSPLGRPTGRRPHLRTPRKNRLTEGFDGYTDGHDEDDSISTDYGSGLGTHRKAATAVVSSRPRRTRRSHELREVEEDEDEELVHQEPVRKKSSPKSPINAIPRRRTRRYTLPETTDDNTEEDEEEQQRPRKYSLQRSSPQSCKKRVSHEDNSIRRSTRQKKLLYGTFNQSLIVKHQMLMGDEGGDEEEVEEDREHDRRKRKRSSEVEPTPEQDGLDMYSRVKRTRRQVKREIYGMPVTESAQEENSSSSDSSEEEEEEESEEEEANEGRTYHLRVHKPRTNLYEAPPIVSQKRVSRGMLRGDTPPRHAFNSAKYRSPAHKSPRFRSRKRPAFHGSSSTSSSSGSESDDERQFERRKAKSMARNRNRCLPMNFTGEEVATGVMRDRTKIGTSLADVDPMSVDKSVAPATFYSRRTNCPNEGKLPRCNMDHPSTVPRVTFESVGGLGKHIRSLKEMIVFPLLYPEVFERFKITPPRGVLFYGPPGTGKTLVARALANECSNENRKVAFFMRKGADCLSKWVGESERQLRLLFDQAYQMRPSIIFFDEIDGLAPVRSSRQDQIHSSIVSTLLALMDGLDNRGEIVIIGATNRLDSIDPALRRPGRFDREFLFPLPTVEARKQILQINTKEWNPKLCDSFLSELSEHCVGYCGADLKALCTEGALHALRRRYPQIYTSEDKLELDVSAIEVQARDFHKAMQCIVPASQRSVSSPGHALDKIIRPLLANALQQIIIKVQGVFPLAVNMSNTLDTPVSANATSQSPVELCSDDEDEGVHPIFEVSGRNGGKKRNSDGDAPARSYLNFMQSATQRPLTYRPRVLLSGQHGQGQSTHLGPAVLHQLERVPVHVLDLPSLYAVTAHTPEEACAQVFREARRTSPSILYMPHIGEWWHVINETLQATFMALLYDLDPSTPIMLVATSEMCYAELPRQIKSLFCDEDVMSMKNPTETERRDFFEDLLLHQIKKPPSTRKVAASRVLEVLPKAKPIEPRKLTESELKSVQKQEEKHLRELRLFLRDILTKLGRDRKFAIFAKPVDTDDVPDYYEIITNPMDLSTMMTKIDLHQYEGVKEFLEDINCICSNALEYNPDRDSAGRAIRHRACALRDTCQALIEAELDPEFEKICNEVREARRRRGELPTATVPSFYYTKPIQRPGTAPGSQAAYPARFCRRGAALEDDLGTTPEQMTDTGPKIRAIVRKVRVISAATKKKSPWCRPTRRHYRKVIVYVDEFGNEVPPPDSVDRKDGAKDAQQDEDGHDTDKTIEMDKEDEVGTISPAKDQTGEMAEDKACLGSNSSATCSTRPSRRGHIDVTQGLNTSVEYKCKVRAVIKRVKLQPSSATRDMNRKKSPWCRTRRKSRFKTMIVYIDEFGNEVPPPPGATGRKNGTKDCEPGKDEVIEYNKMDKSKQMDIDSKVKASETAIEEKENKPLTNAPNSPSRSRPTSPNAMPKLRSASGPSRPGRSPVPSGILMRSTSPHSTSLHSTHTDLPTETPHRLQQSGIPRAALAMEVKPQRRRSSRCSGHGASEAMEIISQMSPTEKTVECAPPEQLASQSNLAVSPTSNPSSSAISKGLPPPHTTSPPQPASAPSTSTPSPEKAASPPAADTTTTNEAPTENRPVENAEKSASPKMRMTRSKSQVPAAVEALAKQVLEAEVPISVIIDDDTLSFLLAKTVRTTENATVEHLEKVYCRLSQAIFSHRDQIDKTQLVQDLEQIISSVSTNHHSSA